MLDAGHMACDKPLDWQTRNIEKQQGAMRNVGGTHCTTGCFIQGRGIPLSCAVRIGHDASAPCWACSLQPTVCRDSVSTPHSGVFVLRPHPSCTELHRSEGCEAIPIREQGTGAAIVLVAGFLRHGTRPGICQLAATAIITEQHVGDACAFS